MRWKVKHFRNFASFFSARRARGMLKTPAGAPTGSEKMKSHGLKILVSLALTVVLLYFFFRGVDLAQTREAILGASPLWLAASLAVGLLTFLLRAVRWTWILRPVARVGVGPAFAATATGFAANNLPGKVGEVLRPYLLSRSQNLPFSPLLASILLERVFDGASVIFFFLLAMAVGLPRSGGFGRVLAPAALLAVLIAVVLFAVFRRKQAESLFLKMCRWLPARFRERAAGFALTFVDGFASLKSPALLATITAGSLVMWFVINVQIYCVLRAFALPLPLSAAYVVTAAAVLGLAVPTPGGLGSYQVAVMIALTDVFSVERATATSVALVAWATSFVFITLIGLGLLLLPSGRGAIRESVDGRRET
jgi:glycosyltransferase 2 family protein